MPEANALVNAVFQALNARDADALSAVSSSELSWIDLPGLPGASTFRGAEAVIDRVLELDQSFTKLRFRAEEIVGEGNGVLVRIRAVAAGRGSGAPVEIEFFSVFTIAEGMVVSVRSVADRATAEQLIVGG